MKSLGNPLIGVGYLRVSTQNQPYGTSAQKHEIEGWAKRTGVTIAVWFEDIGTSGSADLAKRLVLGSAIRALREHNAGVFVVGKRDRLARSLENTIAIERLVERAGARIVTADGVGNAEDPNSRFMRNVIDSVAELERNLISARTKAALAVLRRRGEVAGVIPYGQRLGSDGKHLEEHPAEARVIAQITELHQRGVSMRRIAFALNDAGYRTRRGGPFDHCRVGEILVRAGAHVRTARDGDSA